MSSMSACSPESLKEYEPLESGNVQAIAGTWKGSSLIQRDMDAERKDFPFKSLNITQPLAFNEVSITLNTANGAPSTFTIAYGNAAPILKFTTGTWKVDNTSKVGQVQLINGGDTLKFKLGSYNLLANSKMQWTNTKKLFGKEVIAYDYTFTK